jgi:hypothetical protein
MLDELERIRAYRDAIPEPDAATIAAARGDLMKAVRTEPRPAAGPAIGRARLRKAQRRRRFALAGGIAVAGLAVAGVLGFQGSGLTPSPALAATMDRLAHIAADQGWGDVPGPGQYLYTKSESVQRGGAPVEDRQAWFPSRGQMLDSAPQSNRNDGQVVMVGGPSTYFPTTVSGWNSLSSDPATLLQQIHKLDGGPDTPAEDFTNVGDALRETPIPPAVRALLYRAVALIPGVRLIGPQSDPTGQSGLGVGYYADGTLHSELIFDQQTARLLGEVEYDQAGNLLYAASYIEQEIVDNAPSAGSLPPSTEYPPFQTPSNLARSSSTTPAQSPTTTTP